MKKLYPCSLCAFHLLQRIVIDGATPGATAVRKTLQPIAEKNEVAIASDLASAKMETVLLVGSLSFEHHLKRAFSGPRLTVPAVSVD